MRGDTTADINRCLLCDKDECTNCLETTGYIPLKKFNWDRKKITRTQREYLDFYWLGFTDEEIAKKLGKTKASMTTRRFGLGLPFLSDRLTRAERKIMARKVLGGRRS